MVSNKSILALTSALVLWKGLASAMNPQPPDLVSVRWDTGEPSVGICGTPRFSPNNRYLSFGCIGDDLVPGDNNDRYDSFVLNRYTGTITRASVSSAGQEMGYDSFGGVPSNDGLVVFPGRGPLHPDYGPPPPLDVGRTAVYLRDPAAGTTELITRDAHGQALTSGLNLYDASLSRSEILIGYNGDLRVGPHADPAIGPQIWVKNWASGAVELISATPLNGMASGGSYLASFSPTGRYVIFRSDADDLGPPARLGDGNLYVRDRETGNIERLTYPWAGGEFVTPLDIGPLQPRMSADGRFVVFSTNNAEIHADAPGDGGTYSYLLDRQTQQLTLLSPTPGYPSYNVGVDISDDGRFVAWHSRNGSFMGPANPPADMRAIWVLDRQTGQRVNVTATLGPLYLDNTINFDLSPDGSMIAFSWRIADTNHPLFGRLLLYTAQLRGAQPAAPPTPVPALSFVFLSLLGIGVLLLGRQAC